MLKYFWIAEYKDSALPQFDPETGKENLFKEIDQSKLIRFGLYPFSMELWNKVNGSILSTLPKFIINLSSDDKLVFKRRNYIIKYGRSEIRKIEYLIGTQNYVLHIDESGNVEIKKE